MADDRVLRANESKQEQELRSRRVDLFQRCPIPPEELLENLLLFVDRRALTRVLGFHELYRQIINVPGVVLEFGVRWGRDLALLEALRGLMEPFNHTRKIVGFDTFAGFPDVSSSDGGGVSAGALATAPGFADYLSEQLATQELANPIPHVSTTAVIEGDVRATLPDYLERHPQTIVALAYFDLDLYEPTRACLEAVQPYLVPGSVLAFDELGHCDFPGETIAVREVTRDLQLPLRRLPYGSHPAYAVI